MFVTAFFLALAVFATPPTCLARKTGPTHLASSGKGGLEPFLGIPYKLTSTDANFDKVLKKIGMDSEQRKKYEDAVPIMKLVSDWGEFYTLSVRADELVDDVTFKFGVIVSRTTLDGRHVQSMFEQQGSSMTETQMETGKPNLVIERHFTVHHVLVRIKIDNIVSNRVYTVQQ